MHTPSSTECQRVILRLLHYPTSTLRMHRKEKYPTIMKSQIPMTYLPTKQGGGGEPTLSSEVLINYQAYARSLEPAGPL